MKFTVVRAALAVSTYDTNSWYPGRDGKTVLGRGWEWADIRGGDILRTGEDLHDAPEPFSVGGAREDDEALARGQEDREAEERGVDVVLVDRVFVLRELRMKEAARAELMVLRVVGL